jgi:hypothetical protein
MTQAELNREVSRQTGESVGTIERLGFSLVEPPALKPLMIDWDALEAERGVVLFPVRPRQPAAA